MDIEQTRKLIVNKIKLAERTTPNFLEANLPATLLIPEVPEWHNYEYHIWKLGEDIRNLILTQPLLRKDRELFHRLLNICTNPNSKRGRQSFILLFGYKELSHYSSQLITQIEDEFVTSHIIDTILKMKEDNYCDIMQNFITHPNTLIRNNAKKYIAKHKIGD